MRLKESTGDWNLYKTEDSLSSIDIDIDQFNSWLKRVEEINLKLLNYVNNLELPTLSLYYEDLLIDESTTLKQVCSFLGVEYKHVKGKCMKSTNDDLRNVIINFDELRSHYIGTPYEPMFDEVLVHTKTKD